MGSHFLWGLTKRVRFHVASQEASTAVIWVLFIHPVHDTDVSL
jgi:hypothetical protein